MKVKIYSWVLAAVYLLCGVWLFVVVPVFRKVMYSEAGVTPSRLMTKIVLAVGPLGWLMLSILAAVVIVLKDLRYRSRLLNALFSVFLFCVFACVVSGLLVAGFGPRLGSTP